MTRELLPCPFCGASDPRKFNNPDEFGRPSHGIQCTGGDCAICGPECETENEAIAAWNRRSQPSGEPMQWHDGEPPKHIREEWFIAALVGGGRVVLRALPEDWTYDYTTQDDTFYKADRIKNWMQFPDSEFVPYNQPEGK